MKMKLLILTVVLGMWTCGSAFANSCKIMNTEFYFSGKLGPAFLTQVDYEYDFDTLILRKRKKSHVGFFGTGAIGYKFCNGIRVEGEVAYRHFSFGEIKFQEGFEFETITLKPSTDGYNYMGNVYYDMNFGYCLLPYIGAGIGYIHTSCAVHARDADKNSIKVKFKLSGLAWQWMAGLNYKLCNNVDLMAEYRMMQNESNNNLSFGLRKYF